MKKNILFKVVTFIIASCLISCANDDTNIQENNKSVKTKAYSSQVEEAKALALPVDKINNIPKSIKDKRAAAVILSNYVSIKDSLYSIDISKEDAQKLGIDADLYTSILQDLELSNKIIKEARQKGEKPNLPNELRFEGREGVVHKLNEFLFGRCVLIAFLLIDTVLNEDFLQRGIEILLLQFAFLNLEFPFEEPQKPPN